MIIAFVIIIASVIVSTSVKTSISVSVSASVSVGVSVSVMPSSSSTPVSSQLCRHSSRRRPHTCGRNRAGVRNHRRHRATRRGTPLILAQRRTSHPRDRTHHRNVAPATAVQRAYHCGTDTPLQTTGRLNGDRVPMWQTPGQRPQPGSNPGARRPKGPRDQAFHWNTATCRPRHAARLPLNRDMSGTTTGRLNDARLNYAG